MPDLLLLLFLLLLLRQQEGGERCSIRRRAGTGTGQRSTSETFSAVLVTLAFVEGLFLIVQIILQRITSYFCTWISWWLCSRKAICDFAVQFPVARYVGVFIAFPKPGVGLYLIFFVLFLGTLLLFVLFELSSWVILSCILVIMHWQGKIILAIVLACILCCHYSEKCGYVRRWRPT